MNDYNKLENAIISTLETTIGKTKTRTDKPRKPTEGNTKKAKLRKKAAKMAFQIACNEGQDTTKATKLKEYLEAQKTYRSAVEECERARTEQRIKNLVKKAKINPNEIWQARKRSQYRNELEYNTITEEGETLTDPEKNKGIHSWLLRGTLPGKTGNTRIRSLDETHNRHNERTRQQQNERQKPKQERTRWWGHNHEGNQYSH